MRLSAPWTATATPDVVVSALNASRRRAERGKASVVVGREDSEVGFDALGFDAHELLLADMLEQHAEVPDSVHQEIVGRAVFDASDSGLTKESLARAFVELERRYLRKRIRDFVVLTTLSAKFQQCPRPLRVDDCVIRFSKKAPRDFDVDTLAAQIDRTVFAREPAGYTFVRIETKARCARAAEVNAINKFDLLRACWNVFYNGSTRMASGRGRYRPINRLISGPWWTLHEPNGSLTVDRLVFWEPKYISAVLPHPLTTGELRKLSALRAGLLRAARSSGWGEYIETALLKYVRAMDEPYLSAAFLKLWGVLEFITGTDRKDASHQDTVKRAAFVMSNCEVAELELDYLRRRRNEAVHSLGPIEESEEQLAGLLDGYVLSFIRFMLHMRQRFRSASEFQRFLDSPYDQKQASKNIDDLKVRIHALTESTRLNR